MKAALWIIIVSVLVAGGWYAWQRVMPAASMQSGMQSKDAVGEDEPAKMDITPATTAPAGTPVVTGTPSSGGIVEIAVSGQNFSFSPKEIRVKKGDTVKVTFTSTDGFHDFVIDAFKVHMTRVQTGESSTAQFVADKTGTFEYYCSVGTHREMGMVGKLIVE